MPKINEVIAKTLRRASRSSTTAYSPGLLKDRKSTRLNSSHIEISYAVFCLKKKMGARGMIDLVVDCAEDRDDGVADVLLDEPVERPDLDRDRVPGGAHVLVELFRVEALRERGESRDVGEKHRDLFCLALDGLKREETGPAFSAEAERDRHLGRALRTGECRSPHQCGEVTSMDPSFGCLWGVLARPPLR